LKIAITGGLGFIGTKLARRLVEQGHTPVLIDSLTPQIHGELPQVVPPEGTLVVRADVRELAQRPELIDGCDAVYHLAAETGTGQSMYRIQQYVGVNELGTAALMEAIAACQRRPRVLVLASSRSVYGEGTYEDPAAPSASVHPLPRTASQLAAGRWDHVGRDGSVLQARPTSEDAPVRPGSVYAATKAAQELLVTAAAPALGVKTAVLRFQNVYGEGQSLRNPYTGIISIFFNRARQGLEIPVYEDGKESRDFVHVDDVVEALLRALPAEMPHGTVINVGAGVPTSVTELAQTLTSVAGLSVPIRVTGQFRVGDIRHCYADMTRARHYLGFEPRLSLQQGLTRFVDWARSQPVYEDQSAKATEELRRIGLTNAA
jgi:dTDP-L-rhamnose 4-epimerase